MSTILGSLAALVGILLLAGVLLWIRDRLAHRAPTQDELQRQSAEYEMRLRNPQWEYIASEFGGSVPVPVENLFRNEKLISSSNLQLTEDLEIASFVPADDSAFDPEQWFNPAPDAFVFAVTPFGDPIFVRTSETAVGLPVFLYYHDGGDIERLDSTMASFVDRLSAL